MRKRVKIMIVDDIFDTKKPGYSFNEFILYQTKEKKESKRAKAARKFMLKEVLLMHRVALMQKKVLFLLAQETKNKEIRREFRRRSERADRNYDEALKAIKLIEQEI